MLLTERKVRNVIRRTIVENNYKINERFYRRLENNLLREFNMQKIKNGLSSSLKSLKNIVSKENSKNSLKKTVGLTRHLLTILPLIVAANTVSAGIGAEHKIAYTKDAAVTAALGMADELSNEIASQDFENAADAANELGEVADGADAQIDAILSGDMSIKEMKRLISQYEHLKGIDRASKALNDLEIDLNNADIKMIEIDVENEYLAEFADAMSEVISGNVENLAQGYIKVANDQLDQDLAGL